MKCLKCPNQVTDGAYKFCLQCEKKPYKSSPVINRPQSAIPSFYRTTFKLTNCHFCGADVERVNDQITKSAVCFDCRVKKQKERAPKYYKKVTPTVVAN